MVSMLNEAVVHGFDAAIAANRPVDVDAGIAAALIGNHRRMLTSPTWERQRPESAHALRGTRPAGVTLTGPAGSLFLTLIRRLPLTDHATAAISIDGDVDLARHWLGHTAHAAG